MNLRSVGAILALWLGGAELRASLNLTVNESAEEGRAYALMGDPSAQFNLAVRYRDGRGIKKDLAQAISWLRKAAANGQPEAQYNLAVQLAKGAGVARDEKEAVRWFRAAAEQGVFEAQKALIVCYGNGVGVEKSAAKALTWDFFARRTLELVHEQPAGSPPKPPKLGPNGFGEYVTPEGQREIIGADGSVAQLQADGTRMIQRTDGGRTIVAANGERETKYPDGRVVNEYADGRRVTRAANGAVQTLLPDGTREVEIDGLSSERRPVRITDRFDKKGVRVSRRIVHGAEIVEESADGQRRVETSGEDEQGRRVQVIRRYAANGTAGSHRLVREDGVERTGEEIWVIKRWVNRPDGQLALLRERYGLGNIVTEEQVLETRPWPTKTAAVAVTPAASQPAPPPAAPAPSSGTEIFQPKVSIDAQLAELARLARSVGYYAGATEADYDRARTAARGFLIELAKTPQKTTAGNSGPTPLVAPPSTSLKEIPTDRSDVHPLGLCGRVLVKGMAWKHAETEHFVVHYLQEADAKPVMRSIECAYLVVTQALRINPAASKRKTHVFIFADSAMWGRFTKALGMPPEVVGFAYKDELLLGAHDERDIYLKTLCHEAAHALVAHFYPGRKWPLWLTEGFAEYVSAKSRALARGHKIERYLAKAGPLEVRPVFDRIRYGLGTDPQISTENVVNFYAQSEKCVRVLLEKLPASAFPRFANLAFAGNSMSACLRGAYGETCADAAQFEALVNSTP